MSSTLTIVTHTVTLSGGVDPRDPSVSRPVRWKAEQRGNAVRTAATFGGRGPSLVTERHTTRRRCRGMQKRAPGDRGPLARRRAALFGRDPALTDPVAAQQQLGAEVDADGAVFAP